MHFSGSYFLNPNHSEMPIYVHLYSENSLYYTVLHTYGQNLLYYELHALHAAEKAGL